MSTSVLFERSSNYFILQVKGLGGELLAPLRSPRGRQSSNRSRKFSFFLLHLPPTTFSVTILLPWLMAAENGVKNVPGFIIQQHTQSSRGVRSVVGYLAKKLANHPFKRDCRALQPGSCGHKQGDKGTGKEDS